MDNTGHGKINHLNTLVRSWGIYTEQKWKPYSTKYVFLSTWIDKDYERCLDYIAETSS